MFNVCGTCVALPEFKGADYGGSMGDMLPSVRDIRFDSDQGLWFLEGKGGTLRVVAIIWEGNSGSHQ